MQRVLSHASLELVPIASAIFGVIIARGLEPSSDRLLGDGLGAIAGFVIGTAVYFWYRFERVQRLYEALYQVDVLIEITIGVVALVVYLIWLLF